MVIVEIGLNHLGSKEMLSEFLKKIPDNVDGISIQILSDEFFNNPKYSKLKLSEEILFSFINKLLLSGKKVGLAIDDHTKINKFMPDKISFYKILSKDIDNKELIDAVKTTNAESIFISFGLLCDLFRIAKTVRKPKPEFDPNSLEAVDIGPHRHFQHVG